MADETTPPATSRPTLTTLDEAAHLREMAITLSSRQGAVAATTNAALTDLREQRIERRFESLERGVSALLQSQARQLELASVQGQEQKKNTALTQKSSTAATVAAYGTAALTLFVGLSKAYVEFGVQNPGAPITTTAALLIVARAFAGYEAARSRAKAKAEADAGAASTESAPPPPPVHS